MMPVDKWPKVTDVQQQTLEDLIQSLDCVELNWPHTYDSVERFIEDLMNFFPTGSDDTFRVNPHPIVGMNVIDEPSKKVQ